MKTSRALSLACIALALSTSAGCKQIVKRIIGDAVDKSLASGASAAASADSDDEGDGKLDAYIECYNRANEPVHHSERLYNSWVDEKKGVTGKETSVNGTLEIGEYVMKTCRESIPKGKKAGAPDAELDKAAAAYLAALEAVEVKNNAAHSYYDRKDYKDDKFAKGKEMHAPLIAAFEAFDAASTKFGDLIDVRNDKRMDAELAAAEKHGGKNLHWHKMIASKKSKDLLHLMGDESFDVVKAETMVKDITAHLDATTKYAADHKAEEPMMWSMYASALKGFVDSAKARMRHFRDKEQWTTGERMLMERNPEMVDASSAKLSKQYNELVERGNGLQFKE
jgi:hypothetical protein